MASAALKARLSDLINYMFAMDFLGDYFKVIQTLDDGSDPSFMAEIVPLFGHQVEGFLSQLTKLLGEPLVDFLKVDAYLGRLLENSSYMGAKRVTLACNKFRNVCQENDKEGCVTSMQEVRREFDELYKKLKTILQLKQQIQAIDSKQIIGVSKL